MDYGEQSHRGRATAFVFFFFQKSCDKKYITQTMTSRELPPFPPSPLFLCVYALGKKKSISKNCSLHRKCLASLRRLCGFVFSCPHWASTSPATLCMNSTIGSTSRILGFQSYILHTNHTSEIHFSRPPVHQALNHPSG